MNVVLCSGVMRSGSTWSYNVCRALINTAAARYGLDPTVGYLEGDALDEGLKQIGDHPAVLKTHWLGVYAQNLVDYGQVKNVCTVRDPRDCVASRLVFAGEDVETATARVKQSFVPARRFGRGTLFVDYSDIVGRPEKAVLSIMAYLGFRTDADEAFAAVLADELSREKMALRAPESAVDAETQLHPNHIGTSEVGRWKRDLADPESVTAALSAEIDWYLSTTGETDAPSDVPAAVGL